MGFDIDGFYIREQGFQQDLKVAKERIKAELDEKYQDQKKSKDEKYQKGLETAKTSDGLSHIRSKAIKDAQKANDFELLKLKKIKEQEYKQQIQKEKEFLEKRHFEGVSSRQEQLQEARLYKKQKAIEASNKGKEDFNRKSREKEFTRKFNAGVIKDNNQMTEAFKARAKESREVKSIKLKKSEQERER